MLTSPEMNQRWIYQIRVAFVNLRLSRDVEVQSGGLYSEGARDIRSKRG